MGVFRAFCVLLMVVVGIMSTVRDGRSTEPTEGRSTEGSQYGDTYTPEELAAIERVLWAGNMTLGDLAYKKDYTEGKACFPIVREMLDDPLMIAPWMDGFAMAGRDSSFNPATQAVINIAYELWGEDEVMSYEEWALSSDWSFELESNSRIADWEQDYFPIFVGTDYVEMSIPVNSYSGMKEAVLAKLPTEMAWHDVIEISDEENTNLDIETSELYDLLEQEYDATNNALAIDYLLMFARITDWLKTLPAEFFPEDQPVFFETEAGLVCIGTTNDDHYLDSDFVFLIEPGGNDTYTNCRLAGQSDALNRRASFFVDFGGDDFYDCADVDITLGAAVLGVAAFYDLGGGDDRYYAGSCSLGAAMGGIATFYDDGGSDFYSGKVFTQGAAGFGIGIMVDDAVGDAPEFDTAEGNEGVIDAHELDPSEPDVHSQMDNDYYTAWSEAQAFARTRGVALCINKRGNEVYHAGGVYLHAPLFSDRYQSFSQGFAIGERGIDYAGGIAMLIDYEGNDRYLGDIYNQGVGYWYSAGLLWDGGGNDTYEMTQYGQGSGIHLAVGGLVDVSGNDTYIMHSGLGQGSSHDLAVSVLHDRAGNDRYLGNTTCNGAALAGSVGLFIDRSGNDIYAGKRKGSINYGDGRRTNIGMFIDLAGEDDYMLAEAGDGVQWRQTNIGLGLDWDRELYPDLLIDPVLRPAVAVDSEGLQAGPPVVPEDDDPTTEIPIPEICSYEGDLTQEVFDELWAISIRWAVGDNSTIVPFARKRLIDFGPAVLPYMGEVMDDSNSGLALRAFVEIYKALWDEDNEGVASLLRNNAADLDDDTRRQNALYLVGELANIELEDIAVTMLDDPNPSHQRRAIGVLGKIGSHAGNERLLAMLENPDTPEEYLSAAITTLTDLEVDCIRELFPLLDHDLFTIREQLIKQLVKHYETYGLQVEVMIPSMAFFFAEDNDYQGSIWENYRGPKEVVPFMKAATTPRAIRSALAIMLNGQTQPNWTQAEALAMLLQHGDWGIRGDAAKLIRRWQELADEDEMLVEQIVPAVAALEEMLLTETDPYVLFAASQKW